MPEWWNLSQPFSYIFLLYLDSYLEEEYPQIYKCLALKMLSNYM